MASQKFELDNFDFADIFENYTIPYDYIIDPDMSPCQPEVNESITTALAVIYSLVCFLAVTGNVIVMIVLLYDRRTISSTDTYLLHLAVADLLFAVTLPFWIVDAISGWVFGDAMCKIISMLQEINFYSGILFLVCITINRYLSIVHATQAQKQKRPFLIMLVCATVWLVSIALSLPVSYKGEYIHFERVMCYEVLDVESVEAWRITTRLLQHFFGFLIPLAVMIFCYTAIILKLCQTKGFQKHKAMKIIIAVVVSFVICWLPFNITVLVDTLMRSNLIAETCDRRNDIDRALSATQSLGILHSCINPILYAFIGVKFRRNLVKVFFKKGIIKQTVMSKFRRSVSSITESGFMSTSIHIGFDENVS
ncbi:C-X-C chemokine receptor type 2-like isoform X2 [Rhincodon typus]|nr:C-X-C chemokine receptor type 2-like isoform X2 [Rhincodon typus]XP_048454507.1 C-X-C chemokine receptor type 2-like isoform X2 [Rhincodon typus]XP_048454508.1 C-X-C chemokine receptor type 2-like isoform X2 [Rhincodon typus]